MNPKQLIGLVCLSTGLLALGLGVFLLATHQPWLYGGLACGVGLGDLSAAAVFLTQARQS